MSFYFLTDDGVYTATATAQELESGKHPLSRIANAVQRVIHEYQRIQQRPPQK